MTPLVVAGAVSLAKYVVDRIDTRRSGAFDAKGPSAKTSFRSTLQSLERTGSGVVAGNAGGLQQLGLDGNSAAVPLGTMEAQLLQAAEVQAALSGLPKSGLAELEVQADGRLAIRSGLGRREILVSEETRALAQEVYAQRYGAQGSMGLGAVGGESRVGLGGPSGGPVVFLPVVKR